MEIILKSILKYGGDAWTGFTYLRMAGCFEDGSGTWGSIEDRVFFGVF
jgi:hypothetical protein